MGASYLAKTVLALNLVESLGWKVGDEAKLVQAAPRENQVLAEIKKEIKKTLPPLPANPLNELELGKKKKELLETASSNWNDAIRGARGTVSNLIFGPAEGKK